MGEILDQAEELLDRREDPEWVSLSWIALRPLMSSVNQILMQWTPRLVPDIRAAWVPNDDLVIRRAEDTSFVLVGDTGEQDRSQYVVAADMRRVATARQPGFGVICSDVIYPSGDVNDYVHGFYLPYGPRPPARSGPRPGQVVRRDRLARMPLYALPGNHDWHDGLSGFMQHFAGRDELDRRLFGWPTGGGWRADAVEGLLRMLLRRPSRYRPRSLWRRLDRDESIRIALDEIAPDETVPAEAGRRADSVDPFAHLTLEQLRALRRSPAVAAQPAPYFAIDTEYLRVIAIDTGIGAADGHSAIDAEQARWLLRISAETNLPKILLTGKPLLVNSEWKICSIEPAEPGADGVADDADRRWTTVNEIVTHAPFRYVAVIGGDVHNFQYYPVDVGDPGKERTIHYLVCGGGGAYLSATHPIPVVAAGRAREADRRAGGQVPSSSPEPSRCLCASGSPSSVSAAPTSSRRWTSDAIRAQNRRHGGHRPTGAGEAIPAQFADLGPNPSRLLPCPEHSLAHFADILLPRLWRLLRALLTMVIAGAATAGAVESAQPDAVSWWLLAGTGLLALGLLFRVFQTPSGSQRLELLNRVLLVAGAAAVGSVTALAVIWLAGERWLWYLGSWLGLTTAGCLTAWLIRRTTWWREPWVDGEGPTLRSLALAVVMAPALVGAAYVVGEHAGRPELWWVMSAGVALALISCFVRPGTPSPTRWWDRWGPIIGYALQGAIALTLLIWSVFGDARPWAVICGVLMLAVLGTAGVVISALVVWLSCLTQDDWRAEWGIRGHWGKRLAATLVALALAAQLMCAALADTYRWWIGVWWTAPFALALGASTVLTRGRPRRVVGAVSGAVGAASGAAAWWLTNQATDGATVAALFRSGLMAQLLVAGAVYAVVAVDLLRRSRPLGGYKPYAVAGALLLFAGIAALARVQGWVAQGLVAGLVTAGLVLLTLTFMHLVFLGAYTLVFDLKAHRDGSMLTSEEAAEVLDWRLGQVDQPAERRVRQRAAIVFPSTTAPRGVIQEKVSEIFDSDRRPFWRHFLLATTTKSTLTLEVHRVTGEGGEGQPAPYGDRIEIPLGD